MPNIKTEMDRNGHKKQSAAIFTNKPHGDVGQDKYAPRRMRAASIEPSILREPANMRSDTRKRHGSNKRQTVQVNGCVSREIAAEIERLRNQGGTLLSRSAVVTALLKTALRGQIDMQYGALLIPVIEQAIDHRLKAREARFAGLLVHIAYAIEQNHALLTNLLAQSPGITPEILDTILDQSGKRAKAKLARLSPQIAELITIVETWMREKTGEGRPNSS
jgi:hypothetical protein